MKKFYLASILAVLSGTVLAGTSHHWTLKEGEGNKVIKDSTGTLNGKLVGDVAWAREDDRGWFLNYKGGRAEIASSADLNYPEGVIAQIHFSVNLEEIKKPWTCLFSRGVNYSRGWTVMISRDGKDLMVGLCGMKPGYRTIHANIQSNRDYKLVLAVGDGKVQLLLNGKLLNQYPVSGTLAEKPDKLYLGGNLGYPFAGNIYDFKVMPFSKESVQKLLPAGGNATPDPASLMPVKTIKYPALNLADPQGTVKVYDFKKFSPQPDSAKNGWLFRDNMHFVVPWAGVLNSALAPDSVPLTYDPALKGEYDVYAGVRTYTGATSIIVAVGNDNYRISLPGTGAKTHYNIEQIIARKVAWDAASDWVSDTASTVGNAVSNAWDATVDFVSNTATNVGNAVSNAASSAWDWAKDTASSVGSAVAEAASNTWNTVTNVASDIGNGIADAASAVGGWLKGLFKADGAYGIPTGQMFIAREAGAEMVGSIGRKTSVANNDQIVEGIASGVADANFEQNAILREQNSLLRKLLDKDTTVTTVVSTGDVVDGFRRKNRRDGKTVIPVGV